MRLLILAVTLCLAAPAAAQQPDPDSISLAVMRRILANQGQARDYTLVLAHGPMRIEAYLERDGDLWRAHTPPGNPFAEMMTMAMELPVIASQVLHGDQDDGGMTGDAWYAGTEDVGGRRAHVVWGTFGEAGTMSDTLHLYVDLETGQLLRMAFTTRMDGAAAQGTAPGAKLRMGADLADYTTRDGLVVPLRMRLTMAGDMGLSPRDVEEARQGLALAREELEGMDDEAAGQVRVVLDMMESLLLRGEMEMEVRVEDVLVNSGPPAWLEDGEQR